MAKAEGRVVGHVGPREPERTMGVAPAGERAKRSRKPKREAKRPKGASKRQWVGERVMSGELHDPMGIFCLDCGGLHDALDKGDSLWEARCDCGTLIIARASDLKSGALRGCGGAICARA